MRNTDPLNAIVRQGIYNKLWTTGSGLPWNVLVSPGFGIAAKHMVAPIKIAPRPAATILATGEHEGRFYEVAEAPEHGTFATLSLDPGNTDHIWGVVSELGSTVTVLAKAGIRHRDLRPDAILIRHPNIVQIAISRFGAARLSTHDLNTAPPFELSRYMAPAQRRCRRPTLALPDSSRMPGSPVATCHQANFSAGLAGRDFL
jgi:hypothetical protein